MTTQRLLPPFQLALFLLQGAVVSLVLGALALPYLTMLNGNLDLKTVIIFVFAQGFVFHAIIAFLTAREIPQRSWIRSISWSFFAAVICALITPPFTFLMAQLVVLELNPLQNAAAFLSLLARDHEALVLFFFGPSLISSFIALLSRERIEKVGPAVVTSMLLTIVMVFLFWWLSYLVLDGVEPWNYNAFWYPWPFLFAFQLTFAPTLLYASVARALINRIAQRISTTASPQ